jgi:CheY-like chemotaxis protein
LARKILLADDSVTAQNMGRKILADAGYEVTTVNNGSAALKKINEIKPDLIVLDVYMPGYSGLEVCQRLKEAQETARIPVLLTVGKLEPFKPEEAKRVRADSYIVKPFEASELLTALTKLEDKIVPRAEASKPGRFARNVAAIEEGRYDPAVAGDEESGWKNRITFPASKKAQDAEPEDVNDPAIYNPVNKDLRTVVEIAPPHHAPAATTEGHVDLGALAGQGLPTEVTPEEIAALAAAAAQVKRSIASKNGDEAAAQAVAMSEPNQPAPAEAAADSISEVQSSKIENEIPQAIIAEGASHPDLAANHYPAASYSEEPVTMAAAAGASPSRWTAVAVALAPEEADMSLEAEMQKSYAAFAAAELAHSEPAAVIPESPAAVPETPIAEAAAPESHPDVEPASLNELTQTVGEIAVAANDAMSAAASELEIAASAHIEPTPAISSEPAAAPDPVAADALTATAEVPPQVTTPFAGDDSVRIESRDEFTESAVPVPTQEQTTSIPEIANAPQESAYTIPADQNHTDALATEALATDAATMTDSQAQPAPERRGEMAKKESEIAEHTAAAWASWRRIRETGEIHHSPSAQPPSNGEEGVPRDAAAMAVAAGAEQAPEEAFSSQPDSAEIASIVDSVLADLRPKIVEEISRKLSKKK